MVIKDVELETIGRLEGNVRLVSNTLKVKMEKSVATNYFDFKELKLIRIFEDIKNKKFLSITDLFYFLSSIGEEECRSILSDMRLYYETKNEIITFKEYCLTKVNTRFVPILLLIEGVVKKCNFENNTNYCIINTIIDYYNKRPIKNIDSDKIVKLTYDLYNSYITYIKKLKNVHGFKIDENKVRKGCLNFEDSNNRSKTKSFR